MIDFVKTAVQLASHTFPMERREPDAKLLKPCALVADGGSPGIGRCIVEFDCIVAPLGTMTLIAGLLCDVGVCCKWDMSFWITKLSVAPVLACSVRVGELGDGVDTAAWRVCFDVIIDLNNFSRLNRLTAVLPLFQARVLVLVELGRGAHLLVLPPNLLLRVAALL